MFKSTISQRNNLKTEGNISAGKAIIFAHGFGSNQSSWNDVKSYFEHDYCLISYDNAGVARDDQQDFDFEKYESLEGYADDLLEICDELKLKEAYFVGHSASAMIGLIASINRPGLFPKMVLISASPRYINDHIYTGAFTQEDLDSLYTSMHVNYIEWASGFSKIVMRNEERPELSKLFEETLSSLRPDIALAVAKSIFQSDFRLILKFVESKVLILQARNDAAVPAEVAEYLHSKIKGSELKIVNAEGHFPHISAPAEVASAIRQFLG